MIPAGLNIENLRSCFSPEFADKKLWSVWDYETVHAKDGDFKRKRPLNPYHVRYPGSWKEDTNLVTLNYAIKLLEIHDGLEGIAFSVRPPMTLIDVDDCVPITDNELLSDSKRFATYTELSTSGLGIHMLGYGKPQGVIGGYSEIYSDGHWCFVTGNLWEGAPSKFNDFQKVLDELFVERAHKHGERNIEAGKRHFSPFVSRRLKTNTRIGEDFGLTCMDIAPPINPVQRYNGVWQGTHPVHGSRNGNNFVIDTNKDLWKCFRNHEGAYNQHGGGDALTLFAVVNGIISCEDARPGWTDNKETIAKVLAELERQGYTRKSKKHGEKTAKTLLKNAKGV